jgi:nitroreductase
MTFIDLANKRESCRSYDPSRQVEQDKIDAILSVARTSPSACNSQPYHVTVVTGEAAKSVGKACMGMGMNPFMKDVPVMMIISEREYNKTAAFGAKIKHNDYRSIDIGILAATITYAAADLDLGSCIVGWFDNKKIGEILSEEVTARLVIAIGYPKEDKPPREKKRKDPRELFSSVK